MTLWNFQIYSMITIRSGKRRLYGRLPSHYWGEYSTAAQTPPHDAGGLGGSDGDAAFLRRKIERAQANPNLNTLLRVADALEVDLPELLAAPSSERMNGYLHNVYLPALPEPNRSAARALLQILNDVVNIELTAVMSNPWWRRFFVWSATAFMRWFLPGVKIRCIAGFGSTG